MPKVTFEFDSYEDADDIKEVVQRKDVLMLLSDFEDLLRKYWKYYDEEGIWKNHTPFDVIEKIREDYLEIKQRHNISKI